MPHAPKSLYISLAADVDGGEAEALALGLEALAREIRTDVLDDGATLVEASSAFDGWSASISVEPCQMERRRALGWVSRLVLSGIPGEYVPFQALDGYAIMATYNGRQIELRTERDCETFEKSARWMLSAREQG